MSLRPLWLLVLPLAAASFAAAVAAQPAVPAPKPVSLKFDKVTAARALAELTRQTGIPVDDRLSDGGEFSLDLPKTTFWPALDAIARAAHGRVELYARSGRLALVSRPAGYTEPPVSYSGPFRTAVRRITASRDLETGVSSYAATLEVAWEPTLQPFYLENNPRGLVVRDGEGRDLPVREEGSVPAPVSGRLALPFDVPLPAVPRSSARLGLFEGKLSAVVPDKVVTFAFDTLEHLAEAPDKSPARRQERDGVTCRLDKVSLASDRWTVQVTVDYAPGGVALDSYQSRVVNNELLLESKDGSQRRSAREYVIVAADDRRATVAYHFLADEKTPLGRPGDWKLLYRTPASLVEVPLSFSFRDVPLP